MCDEVEIECSKCGLHTTIPEYQVGESEKFDCPNCGEVKFYYVIKGKKPLDKKGKKKKEIDDETSEKH